MARLGYHVMPHERLWKVSLPGDSQPLSFHATREDAIATAVALAMGQPSGRVVIHRADGTIEREETLGPTPRTQSE